MCENSVSTGSILVLVFADNSPLLSNEAKLGLKILKRKEEIRLILAKMWRQKINFWYYLTWYKHCILPWNFNISPLNNVILTLIKFWMVRQKWQQNSKKAKKTNKIIGCLTKNGLSKINLKYYFIKEVFLNHLRRF